MAKEKQIDNPCLVCQKKEAVDSGMCEDCYNKASDYQEQKEEYKDFGNVDFKDHEIEMIQKQAEKTNEQLEELGL